MVLGHSWLNRRLYKVYIAHFEYSKKEPERMYFSAEERTPKKMEFRAKEKEPIRFIISKDKKLEVI